MRINNRFKKLCLPELAMILVAVLVIMTTSQAYAYGPFGARAASMGGAYTAVASDLSSFYWNPAGLSLIQNWAVEMQYGQNTIAAEDSQDLLQYIHGLNPETDLTGMSMEDMQDYAAKLNELDGDSWLVRGGDHAAVAIGYQGYALIISSYDLFYAQSEVDLENVGVDAESLNPLWENNTQLKLSGLHIQEYAVGTGWMASNKAFSMGITAKYIDLKGYSWNDRLWDFDSVDQDDLMDRVEDGLEYDDDGWSADIGIMYLAPGNRFGIVAKNVNSYDLKISDEEKLQVKPEYRLGYVYIPTDRFQFAIDYSISKERDSYGNKLDGRELAIGFEGVLGKSRWLFIRGGAARQFSGDAPVLFALGTGIHVERLFLEIGYCTDQDGDSHRLWGGMRLFF